MVTKDKKPAEKKEEEKEPVPIIPPRAETPKLLKAALEMSEKSGKKGTWTKLKERSNRSSVSLQVHINSFLKIIHCLDNQIILSSPPSLLSQRSISSTATPNSPTHEPTSEHEPDALSQISDTSMQIPTTPTESGDGNVFAEDCPNETEAK